MLQRGPSTWLWCSCQMMGAWSALESAVLTAQSGAHAAYSQQELLLLRIYDVQCHTEVDLPAMAALTIERIVTMLRTQVHRDRFLSSGHVNSALL